MADPELFDEEFTGTESWILGELAIPAPQTGRYFVVVYVPNGENGKHWIALGRAEEFELEDIAALDQVLPQVWDFHETSRGGVLSTFLPCFSILGAVGAGMAAWGVARSRRIRLNV